MLKVLIGSNNVTQSPTSCQGEQNTERSESFHATAIGVPSHVSRPLADTLAIEMEPPLIQHSERMSKMRLKQWGLTKYCKAEEMCAIQGKPKGHARIHELRKRNKGRPQYQTLSHAQDSNGILSTSVSSLASEADEHAQRTQGYLEGDAVSRTEAGLLQGRPLRIEDLVHQYTEEACHNYTPSELKAVELALLQTDYFYHDLRFVQNTSIHDPKTLVHLAKRHASQSMSPLRICQPESPEQLRDLKFVLQQNDMYFDHLAESYS
jgi:hypothetical protein